MLDRAGLLPAPTAGALERTLVEFERTTGHQVVVHVTPSLEGLEIEDYSMRTAEAWKVGQRNLDNGVILTVAPNERRVRIEVGYGLEGVLPDAIASRIVAESILPEFRAGRMDRGVSAGTRAILEVISGEVLPLPARESQREAPRWVVLLWIAFVVLMLLARGLFFTPPFGGPGMRRGGRSGGFPPLGGGFGRGGGFGGGGGGFGGGGGGFGGGGASGRW
ncbi:MAG: TPM domain-containing protein [Deltaproteobacteria bacterium]|nr:TPM domain-containing protein [Deltaproteobacteria bacterium]